jgi:hypothetical protein
VGSKTGSGTTPCTADEMGRYAVTEWSAVQTTWVLSVQAAGFRSYTHPRLTLTPDEPRAIDLSLEKSNR